MFILDLLRTHWVVCLGDEQAPKRSWRTLLGHCGIPLACGALALIPGAGWVHELAVVDGVAIVAGLLFSALVYLVQLRYEVRVAVSRAARAARDRENIDYAFYSSAYAIFIGLLVVVGVLVQDWLAPDVEWLRIASNWPLVALVAHFLMTMAIVLKRLWRLYKVVGLNQP